MGSSSDIKALQTAVAALTNRVVALEKIVIPVVTPPVVVDPPPPPVEVPPVGAYKFPADVVGTSWKVTLESGKDIVQPALATYSDANFKVSGDGLGAVLRAHYGAGTTTNSDNTRCEWREMQPGGTKLASWSAKTGIHTMRHELVVNRLMDIRPITVIGQIHSSSDDVTVFRLEGTSLYITSGNATHTYLVTSNFQLGARHSVGYVVSNGTISYVFDDERVPFSLKCSATGLYFKAGNYAQANAGTAPGGKTSDYAEVVTYGLSVSHT